MELISAASEVAATISAAASRDGLYDALIRACDHLGLRYFALSHHVDFSDSPNAVRLHNYPSGWQEWYDANRLGLSDPIHRASQRTAAGFFWRDVPGIIRLTNADRRVLAHGRSAGLGDGVTIPAHVPGEARGSCTFVAETGCELRPDTLVCAQLFGLIAFEGARVIHRRALGVSRPQVSDRQRQCIALAGAGLSNRSIAGKLGIGVQTVMEHMREARARFGVTTRTELVISLLVAGEICFDDVF